MGKVIRMAASLGMGAGVTAGLAYGIVELVDREYSPDACIESLEPAEVGTVVEDDELRQACVGVASLMISETVNHVTFTEKGEENFETATFYTLPTPEELIARAEFANNEEQDLQNRLTLYLSVLFAPLFGLIVYPTLSPRVRMTEQITETPDS